jgi:hypothetical protein
MTKQTITHKVHLKPLKQIQKSEKKWKVNM